MVTSFFIGKIYIEITGDLVGKMSCCGIFKSISILIKIMDFMSVQDYHLAELLMSNMSK